MYRRPKTISKKAEFLAILIQSITEVPPSPSARLRRQPRTFPRSSPSEIEIRNRRRRWRSRKRSGSRPRNEGSWRSGRIVVIRSTTNALAACVARISRRCSVAGQHADFAKAVERDSPPSVNSGRAAASTSAFSQARSHCFLAIPPA